TRREGVCQSTHSEMHSSRLSGNTRARPRSWRSTCMRLDSARVASAWAARFRGESQPCQRQQEWRRKSAPRSDPPWGTRFDWRIEKRRVRRR
ncbi:hypothetical protein PENTCL1PPCAC_24828, partial [Pristionchus entomophagus]